MAHTLLALGFPVVQHGLPALCLPRTRADTHGPSGVGAACDSAVVPTPQLASRDESEMEPHVAKTAWTLQQRHCGYQHSLWD